MAQGPRLLAEAQGISMVQAALGWVLSHPQVSTVIVGCKSTQQAQENASASGLSLSQSFLEGAAALG
jgi:aryl-alcohol dehydrogenase-like predicted oxidoreductase